MDNYEKMCESFKPEVPEYYNFGFDVVDKWAERDRTKLALVWVDENGENCKNFTFWDMKVLSNKFANILKGNGLKKGDYVLMMLPNIPEWHIAMVAMIKLGVIPIPTTTLCTPRDIEYRVNQAQPKAIIADLENVLKVNQVKDKLSSLKTFIAVGGKAQGWLSYEEEIKKASDRLNDDIEKTRSDNIMLLYFTSGTTGYPKMVIHEHKYALGHYVTAKFWQDTKPTDLRWTITDTGWAKYAWGNIFGQWIIGTAVFIYKRIGRFNLEFTLKILQDYGITAFCAPPTVYHRMANFKDLDKYDLSQLRHCCSAGDVLDPGTIKKWKEKTGLMIYDGFGQTETVNLLANFPGVTIKLGSVGKPTPGFYVSVVDEKGRELSPRKEGFIALKVKPKYPIGLLREYWKNPEAMREAFKGDWYYTGDKAYKDEDGYFWFRGRADDVFNSRGYRISSFEVEGPLLEHPAVAETAVVPTPDPTNYSDNLIKAFIVLASEIEGSEKLTRELQEFFKGITAKTKCPHVIEYVKELPKTISVKTKRKQLRTRELEEFMKKLSKDELEKFKKARVEKEAQEEMK